MEAHYHADVTDLPPFLGIKDRAWNLWYSEASLHRNLRGPGGRYIPVFQRTHFLADIIYKPSFLGNKEGSQVLMILRVRPTLTRFPITILYALVDDTPLHSFTSVKRPRERRTAKIALKEALKKTMR